jgi:hypothetical protein
MIRTLAPVAAVAWLVAAGLPAQAQSSAPPAGPQSPDATAVAAPAPRHHLANCPTSPADFMDSDATAALVTRCLGKPFHENHNQDGRYVYMYSFKGGTVYAAFLFDPSGVLIRVRYYAVNTK